jgi:hypothetical protein
VDGITEPFRDTVKKLRAKPSATELSDYPIVVLPNGYARNKNQARHGIDRAGEERAARSSRGGQARAAVGCLASPLGVDT